MNTTLTLNNGVTLPAIGLGVFQTPPAETVAAVRSALEVGYRHIDTAAAYGNEREVGEALRRSGIPREEVVLETKVWISDYGYDTTLHAWEKSARKLGVDQIDLLILHQPLPSDFDKTIGAYEALQHLLDQGKVRAIGVSNFRPETLQELIEETEVVPAVHQIELHPYVAQRHHPGLRRRPRHPHPGLVADRWDHVLPQRSRGDPRHFGRPGDRLPRPSPWEESRAGHAPLARAAGPLSHPEVGESRTHRRELRRLRLRSQRRRAGRPRRPGHRWPYR